MLGWHRGISQVKNDPFRLNCLKLLLTYPTHLDKEVYRQYFLAKPNCRDAHLWLVHEGPNTDFSYSHTHVLIDFGCCRFESRNQRCFDFGTVPFHPLIHTIDGRTTAWRSVILYFTTEDWSNDELMRHI